MDESPRRSLSKSRTFTGLGRMLSGRASRRGFEDDSKGPTKPVQEVLGEQGHRLIESLAQHKQAATSETSPGAMRAMLLIKREVSENLLKHYWALEHPQQAERLSARGRRQAQQRGLPRVTSFADEPNYPGACRSIFFLPMLSDSSSLFVYWSILIIICDGTYTSLWVPIAAAFESAHYVDTPSGGLDFTMGILFLTDIFLRFHMPIKLTGSFLSTTLHHGTTVARFYVLRGSFVIDILAALPLVILPLVRGAQNVVVFVLLLRVVRLLRVQRIISMMSNVQVVSLNGASGWRMILGQVLSTLYAIIVMVNFSACLWYFTGRTSLEANGDGWLAQEYKFNGQPDESQCNDYLAALEADGKQDIADRLDCSALFFAEGGDAKRWSISVYYVIVTLTTVGYGDITPASMAEVWISMVIMIFGLALFASILGSIADIVATGSRRARQASAVRSKLTDVQQWMEDRTLSTKTRQHVLRFYAEDWMLVHDEQAEILGELPADIAGAAIWDLVHLDFCTLPLLSPLRHYPAQNASDAPMSKETIRALAAKLKPMSTGRGTLVSQQGDAADAVYFLQRGEVQVLHLTQVVATLTAPAVFGEAALLRGNLDAAKKRLSGYRTSVTSMIWRLDMEDIDSLAPIVPNLTERLQLGLKKTLLEKLRLLSKPQLELILLFLKQMRGSAMNVHRIEKMIPRMFNAVDMAIVQILAFYDRQQYQAIQSGLSTGKSSTVMSPRRAADIGFVPHCIDTVAESEPLPSAADGFPLPGSNAHSQVSSPRGPGATTALRGTFDAPPDADSPTGSKPGGSVPEGQSLADLSGPAAVGADEAEEEEVMAEFEAKRAVIEADKKKAEAERKAKETASDVETEAITAEQAGAAPATAATAADHVQIDVDQDEEAKESAPISRSSKTFTNLHPGELSFAGEVTKMDKVRGAESPSAVKQEGTRRGLTDLAQFSFPHSNHIKEVAEEANGRLMAEMAKPSPSHGFAHVGTSASSALQGLEHMSGTQMINAVLEELEETADSP